MEYEQKVTVPQQIKIIKHNISPCLKCGNDEVKIDEYEDHFGFISTVTCKNCKNEVKTKTAEIGAIQKWNNENHIPNVIKLKKKLIDKTKKEVEFLLKLQKERNSKATEVKK